VLVRQLAEPVRFVEQVEAMYEDGARIFVEVGPGRTLSRLVGDILGDRPHTAIACDVPGEHGLHRLLIAVAELVTAGAEVDLAALFADRADAVYLQDVPRRPGWTLDGQLVRTSDGALLTDGLRPARPVSLGAGGAPGVERDAAVHEFLRNTRELVAAQRDVMLGFLGAPSQMVSAPLSRAAPGTAGGRLSERTRCARVIEPPPRRQLR
jgi:acyl transferase domain-containing protein